ncbi:gamma-glutamyltransferase [Sphingomicrobium lutaoense]|uniref:Glutathione hydrolase proenzyme n=1 Tax=Sphingomicrobium lutaoense TaxID=515949 RepID=A0A839YZV6_9SPHN|nr:gamma-glutamyltransferase [Sphingomicrobium lutaoense]MBB3764649.1 gamma-glutamyltranspeptidase/glutathione hydrolase [Sphingomicrobium lutaoense]
MRLLPFAALLLASCASTPSSQPIAPAGAVSSAEPRATAAGEAMLALGGSATDAALATLVALTVVEPQSSGIGGGGFMLRSDAAGNVVSYDGRETAPMAASPDWFLDEAGEPVPFGSVVPGGRSVGVPGNVAMMKRAHDRHGKLAWKQLFTPAIALARDGFPMTERLRRMLEANRDIAGLSETARAIYYDAGGNPHPEGTILRNPELADFLERLADEGPQAFYRGANASRIAETVRGAPVAPAPMQVSDITAYEAKERPPVCAEYRSHRICSMGPPSSGATTMLQILGLVERFDLSALGPDHPVSWHLFAEASRLAYADRGLYLGDGDFVEVPVAGLVDPAYLAERSKLISAERVMGEVEAGTPPGARRRAAGEQPEEQGTSHFAAVDAEGNVVSLTSTIESAFGSGLMVNGYYLNNELTDFSFRPTGEDGLPVANAVAGGKRPRSSMSPTIVFNPEGEAILAVGAAGGSTIITQTAKNVIAVIDWGLSAQDAIELPNIYSPADTLYVEEAPGSEALMASLRAMGHKDVRPIGPRFKANAVHRIDGRWVPAFDPRSQKDVSP